jgi:hypothetical protein
MISPRVPPLGGAKTKVKRLFSNESQSSISQVDAYATHHSCFERLAFVSSSRLGAN